VSASLPRARRWLLATALAALAGSALPVDAQPGEPAQAAAGADGWLSRMRQAASTRNYQGTLVFNAAGVVSSSRVTHFCEGKQRVERVEVLDGESRQVYRHNDLTQTVWTRSRTAVIEQRESTAEFPSLPAGGARVLESYDLRVLGTGRVAGHDAQVLLLKPRDAHRFAQRLWAEQGTGLLLRADILGPAGEVLESAAFSDVAIGGRSNPGPVLAAMRNLDGYRVVRPTVAPTRLEAEGWGLARPVPGFQLVNCVKRVLSAAGEPDLDPGAQVVQAVFSDGMTHVSVFIEPFDAQRHKSMATSLGATHTLMSRSGPWWVTVMGDVPMSTVQNFLAVLERRR
jgi:sigma-E factor negative regulatory protein RseB